LLVWVNSDIISNQSYPENYLNVITKEIISTQQFQFHFLLTYNPFLTLLPAQIFEHQPILKLLTLVFPKPSKLVYRFIDRTSKPVKIFFIDHFYYKETDFSGESRAWLKAQLRWRAGERAAIIVDK
jgi:hypothetical protein